MKKRYEIVWEIFNNCSGNQMRDIHFDEFEIDDPESFVMSKFSDKDLTWELERTDDGTLIYNINSHGLRQRVSFTEI